jgi:hypothetical protein
MGQDTPLAVAGTVISILSLVLQIGSWFLRRRFGVQSREIKSFEDYDEFLVSRLHPSPWADALAGVRS